MIRGFFICIRLLSNAVLVSSHFFEVAPEKGGEVVAIAHAVKVFHDGEGFDDGKAGDDHASEGCCVHGAVQEVGEGDEEEDGHFLGEASPADGGVKVTLFVGADDAGEKVQDHEEEEGLDGRVDAAQCKV